MKHSFIVQRSKWLQGEGGENSALLRKQDNKMCCLGFYALSCGFQESEIFDVDCFPEDDSRIHDFSYLELNDIMYVNDKRDMDDSVREIELENLFSNVDIEIQFED